jgi:hypothetical protein
MSLQCQQNYNYFLLDQVKALETGLLSYKDRCTGTVSNKYSDSDAL